MTLSSTHDNSSSQLGQFKPATLGVLLCFSTIQQHQGNFSIIDCVAHVDSRHQLGSCKIMLASTLLSYDWQALVAAVVVVIALLWFHFAFTS